MKIILGIVVVIIVILAVAAIELWTQVGRYQAYWTRQNAAASQPGELVYVALGDSTAQGIGAASPEKGYVGLVTQELQNQSARPVRTLNFSKSGAKISDVLDRQLPMLIKSQIPPDAVITIEIGANDMGGFEPKQFESQMDELMGKLPKQTIISDIPYFGGGLHRRLEPNVKEANKIMYRLASKHNFKLAKLHKNLKDRDNQFRNYSADHFHPSSYSYRMIWLPAFMEQIK